MSPVGVGLWEQSLLAMNDDTVLQLNRVARIAGKPCSHSPAPTLDCISLLNQCPADAGPAFATNGGLASHTSKINPMNPHPSNVK
ncbi:hypothetical protein SAMN04488697_109183 [Pseudomonas sp. 43mfcvi1.1]|nr:hypothetical protein ATJ40_109183 [Pseudomonas sp. 43mfcvi1.1]SSB97827.1 hypothetical protein SAMN04488697_109183 [Pseudomonas sp. 43mfcvi1.1]